MSKGLVDNDKLFESLKEISDMLNKRNIRWCLALGSVLGAVREQDIITIQDNDIDIYLFKLNMKEYEDLINDFISRDFIPFHAYSNPATMIRGVGTINNGVELMRIGKGRKGKDLNYYFFKHFMFHEKFFDHFTVGKIRGFEVPLPSFTEELMEIYYGESWRIPQKRIAGNSKVVHKRCVERHRRGV